MKKGLRRNSVSFALGMQMAKYNPTSQIRGTDMMIETQSVDEKFAGYHHVVDVDTRAEAASLFGSLVSNHGATAIAPLATTAWGAFKGDVLDPWGVRWTIHSHERAEAAPVKLDSSKSTMPPPDADQDPKASVAAVPAQVLVPTVVSTSAKKHGEWIADATGGKVLAVYESPDGKVMHSEIEVRESRSRTETRRHLLVRGYKGCRCHCHHYYNTLSST